MPDPVRSESEQDELLLQIYALLQRHVRRKIENEADADDVIQDLALRCLVRLRGGTWKDPRKLKSYVRAMVHRHIGRLHKRRNRRKAQAVIFVADRRARHAAWMSPDRANEELDLEVRRRAMLEMLPDRCQLVYRMVREEGASYHDAATAAGVPFDTVRTYIARAHQLFRSEIQRTDVAACTGGQLTRTRGDRTRTSDQLTRTFGQRACTSR